VTTIGRSRVLSIVVCGAGPAVEFPGFVKMAIERGWDVQVIATTPALAFFDKAAIEALTGNPVRNQYSPPGSPRSRIPDAIIVAPSTYNTINKWALGIADTYALGVLAEQTALGIPIVVLPFVNTHLASRAPFLQSVKSLRAEGVSILLGPGAFEPRQPRTGGEGYADYPWHLALDEVDGMVGTADDDQDADA
jgi:phosphopantothenoylcysteine synthetase/decarboxylase